MFINKIIQYCKELIYRFDSLQTYCSSVLCAYVCVQNCLVYFQVYMEVKWPENSQDNPDEAKSW